MEGLCQGSQSQPKAPGGKDHQLSFLGCGYSKAVSDQFLEPVPATVKEGYRSPGTLLATVREFLKAGSPPEQSACYLGLVKEHLASLTQEKLELLAAAYRIALTDPAVLNDLNKLCLADAMAGSKKGKAFIAALGGWL